MFNGPDLHFEPLPGLFLEGFCKDRVENRPDPEARPVVPLQMLLHQVGTEPDDDGDIVDTAARECLELPVDQRLTANRQQAFGTIVRQGRKPRSLPGAEEDSLHRLAVLLLRRRAEYVEHPTASQPTVHLPAIGLRGAP